MIVKQLIDLLAKCNPNATVYSIQWKDNYVNVVGEATAEGVVYLADTLRELKSDFHEEGRTLVEYK